MLCVSSFIHAQHSSDVSPHSFEKFFVGFFLSTTRKDVMGRQKKKEKTDRERYVQYCVVKLYTNFLLTDRFEHVNENTA